MILSQPLFSLPEEGREAKARLKALILPNPCFSLPEEERLAMASSPFLQQQQHLGLAALIASVAAVLLGYGTIRWWKSGIEGIDGPEDQEAVSSSAAAMVESFRAVCEGLGPWGLPLYVLFHALLISFCLPYALILEAGAAYLFGFLRGIVCVFCAKVLAASLSFWIGRYSKWPQNPAFLGLSVSFSVSVLFLSLDFRKKLAD